LKVISNMPENERIEIHVASQETHGERWDADTAIRIYMNKQIKQPKTMFEFFGKYPDTANLILTELQTNMSAAEYSQWRADTKAWLETENAEYERIKNTYGIDPDALEAIEDTLVDE